MVNLNAETLKCVRLFQRFEESDFSTLIELGLVSTHEAHSNIVIEGELSGGLYIILSGAVGVYKQNKLSGNTYDIGQLHEGSFFGEMSLIDDNPRSATVRALTDCQLFYLSKEAFTDFLKHSPETRLRFLENCVKDLVGRLRDLDDNYVISQYQLWKSAVKGNDSGSEQGAA